LILDGTNGLSDVDGSAATPAIRGSDANTGIFFPAADTIAFAEGGVEVARFDASGNLGIGTSAPAAPLQVNGASGSVALIVGNTGESTRLEVTATSNVGATLDITDGGTNRNMIFSISGTERMRIDSSGNLLVGTTSQIGSGVVCIPVTGGSNWAIAIQNTNTSTASNLVFRNSSGTTVGTIQSTTTATSYVTSSDYRLKHDIQPMTGALAKVAALKPVTYKWNIDDSESQGFIAHELQAVVPECVTGEKDAVDAEGSPQYQGIDTSFLVATLTAAIQEQQAIITALTARVEALEGAQA
jgi:hypothetical protein